MYVWQCSKSRNIKISKIDHNVQNIKISQIVHNVQNLRNSKLYTMIKIINQSVINLKISKFQKIVHNPQNLKIVNRFLVQKYWNFQNICWIAQNSKLWMFKKRSAKLFEISQPQKWLTMFKIHNNAYIIVKCIHKITKIYWQCRNY